MPTVKKLGDTTNVSTQKPANTEPVANTQVTITNPTPNKQLPLDRVKIPAYLQKSQMQEVSAQEQTGYIGFSSDSSKNYPAQQAAGLVSGDIYLYHQGQYLKQDKLVFFYATGESFRSVMDATGAFVGVTRNLQLKEIKVQVGPKVLTKEAQPHYVCLCFVVVNGSIIPIKGDFIGTKSGGMEQAIRAVEAAGSEESGWLNLSETHKATRAFPHPFGRVIHTMRTEYKVGKVSGKPYYRAITTSNPASVSDMELLLEHLSSDSFMELHDQAYKNYEERVKFLDEIVKKTDPLNV